MVLVNSLENRPTMFLLTFVKAHRLISSVAVVRLDLEFHNRRILFTYSSQAGLRIDRNGTYVFIPPPPQLILKYGNEQ